MKHLQFDGKYYDLLKSGKKKMTIRIEKPNIKPGDIIYVHCAGKVIGKIKVTEIYTKKLKDISDEEAKLDGFRSRKELVQNIKNHYPRISENKEVVLIKFDWVEIFDKEISSEDFAWFGVKIDPIELAKLCIKYDENLTPKQKEILQLLIQKGSLRKAAMSLGGLHKRDLFRRILRRSMQRLLEKGILQLSNKN